MAEALIQEAGDEIPPPEAISAPESEPAPEEETPAPQQHMAGAPVLLRDRYLVDSGSPIPELDTPSAKAYETEDHRDLGRKMFALVCTPGLPTRTKVMASLKGELLDGLLPLAEWDTVDWPLLGQHSMVAVYDRPQGGRILDAMKAGTYKLNEYDFPRGVMDPLFTGVKNIAALDQRHRAIRPDNVFFMDEAMQMVVLGDCVTAPPGFNQPMLFEPIDRSMAGRGGRGEGSLPDDIYALGVTFVVLILGYNPVGNISDEQMLAAKMLQGSYAAICGNARIPIPLLEPLRGMLNDTVDERWGLEELSGWLEGQKQPSLKQIPIVKSDFPYHYEGHDHYSPRTLARSLSRHRETALKVINDDALVGWLRKGVGDANRADGIKATIDTAALHKDDPEGSDEFVIAKACMVLDPQAPIRYKGFSFMPDGYGPALANEFLQRGTAEIPVEILKLDLPLIWYTFQRSVFAGASVQQAEYIKLRGYLSINEPGYGFERCLYEINPSMPCQSEFIVKDYIFNIDDLLLALDAASNHIDTSTSPMDTHIAAFIAARFEEDIHPHLKALASPTQETATVGLLSLLAFLQWKLRVNALFGLSSWVGGLLGPAINTYYSRTTRRAIEREIPRLVRKGSLPELFDLIDNAENRRTDSDGYEAAATEYAAAEYEIRDIEGTGSERQTKAERTGKQSAAVLSIVLMFIVVSVLFIAEMF